MLKFGAIVPHPPILIPNIGKENRSFLEKTLESYQELVEKIKEKKIDSLILISSHGHSRPSTISIRADEWFNINFEEFGDFSTKMKVRNDLALSQRIREKLIKDKGVQLISGQNLDHGAGVPLYLLCYEFKDIKTLIIHTSAENLKRHYDIGKKIGREADKYAGNTAVVASGDLSHCLSEKAPCGYLPKGAKFDQKFIENLKKRNEREIIETDSKAIEEVKACGPRAIALMLGAMSGKRYEGEILSYEYPFGIGNLSFYAED